MVALDAQHVPFAGTTRCLLDVVDAIDRIRRDPGERHVGGDGALDHLHRHRRLGGEGRASGTCAAASREGSAAQLFAPFDRHYQMWRCVTSELPALISGAFLADLDRQLIMGHSMGGHGALTIGLTHPDRYKAVSAFAPIVAPSQVPRGRKALGGYLGVDPAAWRRHGAIALIEDGARAGVAGRSGRRRPAPRRTAPARTARRRVRCGGHRPHPEYAAGYDHSHHFISTFMHDHLRWHAGRLR